MHETDRAIFYYLYRVGNEVVIRELSDQQALDLRAKGIQWLGVGQKSRVQAEQMRLKLLSKIDVSQP